jgi:hypothetical protein
MMEPSACENLPAAAHSTIPALDSSMTAVPRNSAAIRRLMDEVRDEELTDVSAAAHYNRQHNRHNR